MIFDQVCGIVEKWLPELRGMFIDIPLFHIDIAPHEVLDKSIPDEEVKFLSENFFLPFQTIAIEDRASLIILQDPTEDTTGLYVERAYTEFLPNHADPNAYRAEEREDIQRLQSSIPPGTFTITSGLIQIDKNTSESRILAEGELHWAMLASKDELMMPKTDSRRIPRDMAYGLTRGGIRNATTAIEEVRFLNSPSRFVVQSTPVKMRDRTKLKKIPRSHERPSYTLMTPGEIRTKLKLGPSTDKRHSPTAHYRRRHYRHFRSERFKQARGKSIIIPAMWVGSSETTIGKRRYKVCLEL